MSQKIVRRGEKFQLKIYVEKEEEDLHFVETVGFGGFFTSRIRRLSAPSAYAEWCCRSVYTRTRRGRPTHTRDDQNGGRTQTNNNKMKKEYEKISLSILLPKANSRRFYTTLWVYTFLITVIVLGPYSST